MGVSEKDLKKSKAYLFPMLERYQEGTLSTYFIADMFMLVDMMADGQFLTLTSVWPKTKKPGVGRGIMDETHAHARAAHAT